MIIIISLIFFVLIYLTINSIHDGLVKKVLLAYLMYWGISMVISTFNPYQLNEVSGLTYILLLVNVIAFTVGVLSYKGTKLSVSNGVSLNLSHFFDKIVSNKLFLLFVFICDIFIFYLYQKQAILMQYYSASNLRMNLDELLYEGDSMLGLGKNIFIDPFGTIITFLGAYLLIYRRDKVVPLLLTMIYILYSSMLGGSRGGIFLVVLYCLFIVFCKNLLINKKKERKNHRLSYFLLLGGITCVVIVIMSYMTAQRKYNVDSFSLNTVTLGINDLLKQFVIYSIGPFRALDFSFQNHYLDKLDGFKLGRCTFGFIDDFLALVLNRVGIKYNPANKEVMGILQHSWIDIGGGNAFNFAYTSTFFNYMDFGIIGVVIFPFLFGYIIRMFANKMYITRNPALLVLLSYFFVTALYSIFTWGLYRFVSFFILMYIWIMYIWFRNKKCSNL